MPKPLIGITSDFAAGTLQGRPWHESKLLVSYSTALNAVDGLPVILPLGEPGLASETLARLDGLILSGGKADIPPSVIGEECHPTVEPMALERWNSESAWLKAALAAGKPVLGVCLGMQVMNVVAGGGMVQDIPDQVADAITHADSSRMHQHEVTLEPGSRIARMAPSLRVPITSAHHQAIRSAPRGFRIAATSDDGLIEGIESTHHEFVVGVQWHPERSLIQPDWLLRGFVRYCGERMR